MGPCYSNPSYFQHTLQDRVAIVQVHELERWPHTVIACNAGTGLRPRPTPGVHGLV
jgi:hypothetical protein